MVEKELAEAKRDLDSAKNSLCDSDFKWTIIKAYYSMFHACKSLLFSAGYVEKSHECLIAAIEELFVDRGLLPPAIVSDLRRVKTAREAADYGLTYGKASANGTVREAEQIFDIVSGYLTGEGFETPSP
ncbi:HEPN domain-containing protein [Methanoculleus formosensis]|nr:HEPN domain-containing protein [Methanoculleus sp. Afa-1]